MTAARYKVVQFSPRSGVVLDELPVTGISFTHTLNADGSATVNMPLHAPEARPTSLIPGKSGLAILRDGVPVWGGLIWTASADLSAGVLTLNAAGYHSYYRGRVLEAGYSSMAEQAFMVRTWIETCNNTNGIGTVTANSGSTTFIKYRSWSRSELKNVAEAIEELAEEVDGFAFRYEPFMSPDGRVYHRLIITRKVVTTGGFILEHRINCDVGQVTYDSSAMATRVFALGADNGNGTKLVGVADNPALTSTMAAKQIVATFSDVKATNELKAKASAIAAAGQKPVAIPSVVLHPGAFSPVDVLPGQSCAVNANSGYVRLLGTYVVTETKTDVDANGTESIALALADKDLFEHGSSN